MTVGKEELIVVAAPFPGQAGEQQAYYALMGQQPANSGLHRRCFSNATLGRPQVGSVPLDAARAAAVRDDRHRAVPAAPGGRGPAGAACGASCRSWRRGDLHKIQDNRYGGNVGGLARDINAAIERFTHAPTQRSDIARQGSERHPGTVGRQHVRPAGGRLRVRRRPPPPAFAPPPPPASRRRRRRRRSRRRRCPASPLPPLPAFRRRSRSTPPSLGFGGGGGRRSSMAAPRSRATCRCREPPSRPPGARRPPTLRVRRRRRASRLRQTPTATRPGSSPTIRDEEEEAHFRHIFDDFIAKKRDCGESTVGLTRDKFLQKLRDNKASLVAKHNCRTVRFSVYVKDGKAALKATPVRE